MRHIKSGFIVFVIFLFVISGCTTAKISENKSLDDNAIIEAIDLGKQNKFNPQIHSSHLLMPSNCEEKRQPYCKYDFEYIIIFTPFEQIVSYSADKAKKYEEISEKDIKNIVNENTLIIDVNVMVGDIEEIENVNSIIKSNDKIIKPLKIPANIEPRTCIEIEEKIYGCSWVGHSTFKFSNYDQFKSKKIKFVLIRDYGEKEYEIDMSKYK